MPVLKSQKIVSYIFYLALCVFIGFAGYRAGEYSTISRNDITNSESINSVNPSDSPTSTKLNEENKQSLNANNKDVDFNIFWEAWDIFTSRFVDRAKLDKNKMFYNAVKGMVASSEDPYTFFLTPEENKQSKDSLGGKFEGIGAQLGTKDGQIIVIAPIRNSPAIKAGIKAGDIISAVDGQSTKGKTITDVVTKIRGQAGTEVKLAIIRKDKETVITIKRAQIQVDSIELVYVDQYAHLKLSQFGTSVRQEWDKATLEIVSKYQRGDIKGLILDLRGDPGGLLDACVYIAGDFVPSGSLIVKQVGIEDTIEYKADHQPRLVDIPVVVLIDKGSASASEILAGALRDHKRAKIIGEKSFGKGSVQGTYDLSDGSGMHVTVAKWVLPSGEWINGKGIKPDIEVTNTDVDINNTVDAEKNDKQLQKALEILKI